jgi:hypothetical protein
MAAHQHDQGENPPSTQGSLACLRLVREFQRADIVPLTSTMLIESGEDWNSPQQMAQNTALITPYRLQRPQEPSHCA